MLIKPIFILLVISISQSLFAESAISKDILAEIRKETKVTGNELIYVDFWASWCNPCRKSFPWMNTIYNKHKNSGFKVIAINLDKERKLAEKFLSTMPVDFPIIYDPDGKFAKSFQLKGMPSSYILNASGRILSAHKGFFIEQTKEYEKEIDALLSHQSRGK